MKYTSISGADYVCNGAPGAQGSTGAQGLAGADGISVIGASEAPGTNCIYGGTKYTSVSGVDYVCNGAPGAQGDTGAQGLAGANGISVVGAPEAPGTNCTYGGVKYTSALGVDYVCNGAPGAQGSTGAQGPAGADGVSVTGVIESPGAHCASGGIAYTSASGVNYVCDGATGPQGIQGLTGATGPRGPALFDAVVAPSGGDYTDLKSAVDAGKNSIFVKNGTYPITAAINIGSNRRIEGETATGVIFLVGAYLSPAAIAGDSNNTIRNFTLNDTNVFIGQPTIRFTGSGNVIDGAIIASFQSGVFAGTNCRVTNSSMQTASPVLLISDGCRITTNALTASTGNGPVVDGSGVVRVDGNTISHSSASTGGSRDGVRLGSGIVINNELTSVATADGTGVDVSSGARIIGNRIVGFRTGIHCAGSGAGGAIHGNVVQSPGSNGIDVVGPSNAGYGFVTVVGNSVFSAGGGGIRISGLKLMISSNAVYGSAGPCFLAGNGLTAMTISNNLAEGCVGYGFDLNAGLTLSTFSGNTVINTASPYRIASDQSSISSNVSTGAMELTTCLASSFVGNWVGGKSGTCSGSREAGNSWN